MEREGERQRDKRKGKGKGERRRKRSSARLCRDSGAEGGGAAKGLVGVRRTAFSTTFCDGRNPFRTNLQQLEPIVWYLQWRHIIFQGFLQDFAHPQDLHSLQVVGSFDPREEPPHKVPSKQAPTNKWRAAPMSCRW